MKKLMYFLFASLMVVQACKSKENKESSDSSTEKKEEVKSSEAESKKGYWTTAHEQDFLKSCEAQIMALKDTKDGQTIQAVGINIEEFGKKSCSCALEKVEKNYENIIDANKDLSGINKIGEECGEEVMKEMMKK